MIFKFINCFCILVIYSNIRQFFTTIFLTTLEIQIRHKFNVLSCRPSVVDGDCKPLSRTLLLLIGCASLLLECATGTGRQTLPCTAMEYNNKSCHYFWYRPCPVLIVCEWQSSFILVCTIISHERRTTKAIAFRVITASSFIPRDELVQRTIAFFFVKQLLCDAETCFAFCHLIIFLNLYFFTFV